MLRVASPIAASAPSPGGGGNVQQVCGVSMKTSISLPRRSQRRKRRVLESYEEDPGLFSVQSPASKKLFSSRGDFETLKIEPVVVKSEVEIAEKLIVSTKGVVGDCKNLRKQEEVEDCRWCSLGVGRAELCLDLTLPTGQCFAWRKTGLSQYTGVVGAHLVSLHQVSDEVEFLHHSSSMSASMSDVEIEIREYLNLDTSLVELYAKFSVVDARFAAVAPFIAGAWLL